MSMSRALKVLALVLAVQDHALAGSPEPLNVVHLSAVATVPVRHDLFTITLSTMHEGAEPASVQATLRRALESALNEARRDAQPGAMEVRTGNFSLSPRYGNHGRISGWHGSAELILQGNDLERLTQAVGRVRTMTVAQAVQELSPEQREKHEGEASARAIARFRAQAAAYARQFGFTGYTLREVMITRSEPPLPVLPRMGVKAQAMDVESAPLPVEAGKGTVTIGVSGSVQLTR